MIFNISRYNIKKIKYAFFKMYKLSVGALFKNEASILKEWIEHYLHHGVEHFYLINDNSTDNFLDVLQPYVE